MNQIFTSTNFTLAVNTIPLKSAKLLSKFSLDINKEKETVCIWELSNSDLDLLENINWNNDWGWWRWCEGYYIEKYPTTDILIRNHKTKVFYSLDTIATAIDNCIVGKIGYNEDRWNFDGEITPELKEQFFIVHNNFKSFQEYCKDFWGFTQLDYLIKMVAITAKLNKMNNADFMKIMF